jgi:hypothetical protein
MAVEIRKLELSDSPRLIELFSSGSADSEAWLWQDRSPDFWSVGALLDSQPGRYLGVCENGKLVACSGQASCHLSKPFDRIPCFLDTDLFVHPKFRRGTIAARLIRERFIQTVASFHSGGLLWGVEHEPDGLHFCSRIADQYEGRFHFPLQTELSHLSADLSDGKLSPHVQIKKISDCSEPELQRFWAQYQTSNSSTFIFPRLEMDFLLRLQKAEPDAQILQSENQAGALLCSFEFGRRWKATGRSNLALELIKRKRGWETLQNQPIRYAMQGMFWGGRNEELIRAALAWCQRAGMDGLALRDCNEAHQWKSAVHYKRRVFLGHRKAHREVDHWLAGQPKIQVEVFFV